MSGLSQGKARHGSVLRPTLTPEVSRAARGRVGSFDLLFILVVCVTTVVGLVFPKLRLDSV